MRRSWKIYPLIIAAIVIAFQFFNSEKFVNPETGRKTHVALSTDQEKALGLQSYQEVLSQADVINSGPEYDQVVRVARRLAGATGEAGKKFDWEVSVVRSSQANAFCLPGGKIVVYTGILPITKTDAGLAAVMGHEMAHATSRHGSQRVFQSQLAQTAMMGASFSLSDMDPQKRQTLMAARRRSAIRRDAAVQSRTRKRSRCDRAALYGEGGLRSAGKPFVLATHGGKRRQSTAGIHVHASFAWNAHRTFTRIHAAGFGGV
jgi:predicted Zn-dependent protease